MFIDNKVTEFLDENLQKLIEFPELFGGYYAVELQILRLLEIRVAIHNPNRIEDAVNSLCDRFHAAAYQDGAKLYVRLGYNKEAWQIFLRQFVSTIRVESIPWPPREVEIERLNLQCVEGGK